MKKIMPALLIILVLMSCGKKTPVEPGPGPVNTPTVTMTQTPTHTVSMTTTHTPTVTMTASVTFTETVTETATQTRTITETATMTASPTVTQTATATITPDAASKGFGFEDNTAMGWIKDNNAPATVLAAAGAALPYAGSYSLEVMVNFSSGNDLARVLRSFEGTPVNLSGATIIVYIRITNSMLLSGGVYHGEAELVNYDGTVLPLAHTPDLTVEAWHQAVFTVPALVEYEMIREVRIGVKDDAAASYTGYTYFDNITW